MLSLSSFVSFLFGACVTEKKPKFIHLIAVNSVSSTIVLPGRRGILGTVKVQVELSMVVAIQGLVTIDLSIVLSDFSGSKLRDEECLV